MEDRMKKINCGADGSDVLLEHKAKVKKITVARIVTFIISLVAAAGCYYYGAPLIAVAIGMGIGLIQAEGHFRSQMDKLNEELEARLE